MSDNYEHDDFTEKNDEFDEKVDKNDENDNESENSSSEESDQETETNYCGYQYTTQVVDQNDEEVEDDILIYDENSVNEVDEKKKTYVNKEDRISKPFLTKYERARIIGDRTRQLIGGAKPMIKNYTGIDPKQIAILELNLALDKKNKNLAYLPFIIERPRPDGKYEMWHLNELSLLWKKKWKFLFILSNGTRANHYKQNKMNTNYPIHKEIISDDTTEAHLRLLLKMGYDINQIDCYGNTPLHYAIQYNKLYYTELLIKLGADIHILNMNHDIPLMVAIKNNNIGMVHLLLKYKVSMTNEDSVGKLSPLLFCYLNKRSDMVALLLKYNVPISSYDSCIMGEFQTIVEWNKIVSIFFYVFYYK